MEDKFLITSSPHIRTAVTPRSIMLCVIIALMPAVIFSGFLFGWRAIIITAVSVLSAVAAEALFNILSKKKQTISDCSAALSGLLLAMTLPPTVPLWLPVIGSFFAMIIVKGIFGGLGSNFMNPALAARAFLFISFPSHMTVWLKPFSFANVPLFANVDVDVITTSATPLVSIGEGTFKYANLSTLFFGNIGGCIGETSVILLLLGGLFLLWRRVIRWQIPVFYIGSVWLLALLFPVGGNAVGYATAQILSGGLILGAVFMATDYASSPTTTRGRIIYALGCGVLTFIFRRFGSNPEGVSFAILLMNVMAWTLDGAGKPRRFGKGGAFYGNSKGEAQSE